MATLPSILRVEQPEAIERFYKLLLQRDRPANAITLIDEALHLIATITGATTAYVEVSSADTAAMSRAYDVDARPPDVIGASVSRDVVRQAVVELRTFAFESRAQVTIMCVPIRTDGVIGIVWLEASEVRFSEHDCERAQLLAGWLAAIRVASSRRTLGEETQLFHERCIQEALQRCGGNISKAARELEVSRAFIYTVMKRRRARYRRIP